MEKESEPQKSASGSSDLPHFPLFCPFRASYQILMQTTSSRHSSVVLGASALKVGMLAALESSQVTDQHWPLSQAAPGKSEWRQLDPCSAGHASVLVWLMRLLG